MEKQFLLKIVTKIKLPKYILINVDDTPDLSYVDQLTKKKNTNPFKIF